MSKLGAFLIIVLLFGAIFYVYDLNTNNVGVKIEKLKLKYTIGDNASPEKILSFSDDLSTLANSATSTDKKRLVFESKLWSATGTAKDVAGKLGSGDNFADNCKTEVPQMKTQVKNAMQDLQEAKTDFELIKTQYSNVDQQDLVSRFSNVEYSLGVSEDILYIFCPQ